MMCSSVRAGITNAVAEVFDALTSDRPYRRHMSEDKAAAILLAGRSGQFDPVIVDCFLESPTFTHRGERLSTGS